MIYFLLILLLILFFSAEISKPNKFNTEYLSLANTNTIKGIFVILVIFSHCSQYIWLKGIYDEPYVSLQRFMGQMIVSVFLFYSGFGMMESIRKKGFSYIKTIPTKRFIKILINFDIAVLLYLILDFFIANTYDLKTTLLSFIAWENIGNSNWYILAVLALYLCLFLSFFLLKWFHKKPMLFICTILLTFLTIGFVYFEMRLGKDSYYYNTMILLPLGCWYSLLKPYIDKIVLRNDYIYSLISILAVITLFISYSQRTHYGIESYTIWAVAFTLTIIIFTMKVSFRSITLEWFGKHVFSIYILQRIPMMILHYFDISTTHKYFFIVLSIVCTIFIAQIFDFFTEKLWSKVFSKK